MGVSGLFRWLVRRYPSIMARCIEETATTTDGVEVPVDTTKPNPNGVEFDNLYLDMNNIIHVCSHPDNKPSPKTEDEMMTAMFEYIDRVFNIVRPRRLLYLAVDGVPPRAKINQQRARRFCTSQELMEKALLMKEVRVELLERGARLPPERTLFDSNCITPGTEFMERVTKCLHFYIHHRLNSDPGWQSVEVILSDETVPGEGEHKIMDFIRAQKASPQHDPNTQHCLCGADSDLIMLGLATHEPNFTVIREDRRGSLVRFCDLCQRPGHLTPVCPGLLEKHLEDNVLTERPRERKAKFIFLRLHVLRDLLARDLRPYNPEFEYKTERAIDDWLLLCCMAGNDFIPNIPSVKIWENVIHRLMDVYRHTLNANKGYLTENGSVDLKRLELILSELAKLEDEIFKRRLHNETNLKKRAKEKEESKTVGESDDDNDKSLQPYKPLAQVNLYDDLMAPKGIKRKMEDDDLSDSDEESHDEVRLGEDGWKERYYVSKFGVSPENIEFRRDVVAAYIKGLCWVHRYYSKGCASWKWFYPYYYAPFASDFVDLGDMDITFEEGTQPLKPMEQLMSVLPTASSHLLPEPFADLMEDPASPVIDFYPCSFQVDLNGNKYNWQGVVKLPFVDEKRLLDTMDLVYPLLDKEETNRNTDGDDVLYFREGHSGYDYISSLYEGNEDYDTEFDLDPKYFGGTGGKIRLSRNVVPPGNDMQSVVQGVDDIQGCMVTCARHRSIR
ncbi:5'-3' exoribonuclease 2-like isoform X2 [Amblyomma americanum]